MLDKQKNREWMSALADGQLRGDAFAQAVHAACCEPEAQAAWQMYHLVGDVLRSGELARCDTGTDFVARLQARIEFEDAQQAKETTPVVSEASVMASKAEPVENVAYQVQEAANAANFRWKMVAGLASFAAVAAIGWNVVGLSTPHSVAVQLAQAPAQPVLVQASLPSPSPVLAVAQRGDEPQVMLRDPRLDELLAAHKQWGGGSALQAPAGFLRNATFDGSGR